MSRSDLYPNLSYLGSASGYADEIHAIIDHIPLFGDLSRAEVDALCQHMMCFAAPRGTHLLKEGDCGEHLVLVLTGKVVVSKALNDGAQSVIAEVGPGSTLGEMSLIDGQPRFADCIAVAPTDFAVLTRKSLNEIMLVHPRLANKFLIVLLQMMVERLRDTSTRLLPFLSRDTV